MASIPIGQAEFAQPSPELLRWKPKWKLEYFVGDWSQEDMNSGIAERAKDEAGDDMIFEFEGNILVTAGITLLWNLLIGAGGTVFSNANAYLGVGSANPSALTGTISVTNGSASVTGSGTNFTGQLAVGDMVRVDADGNWYKVLSIGSNTALTLTANYTGTTASGQAASKDALSAAQTDLQAPPNKMRKAMDATYPQVSGASIIFQATLATTDANYAINEVGTFNAAAAGTMLNRFVQYLGTKSAALSLRITETITLA